MVTLPWVQNSRASSARAGTLPRRGAVVGMLAAGAALLVARRRAAIPAPRDPAPRDPDAAAAADWRAFKTRFITPDGRVVDTGNGGVTHSEGQGYGLLFAAHVGDRATFDSVLGWTRRGLRRPRDMLHAWRYRPNAAMPVDDLNNATDGDLLIALALLRAGERWGSQHHVDLGCAIGADILANCVADVGGAKLLLPAAFGFQHPGRVVVNPSYYVFPALDALADYLPDPAWAALRADALRLLRRARFGQAGLPSDWVQINDGALDRPSPARGWPARFGWDAVRVPLHLVWAGLTDEPALAAAAAYWADPAQGGAAWVDLDTGALAPYPACCGVAAVAELTRAAHAGTAAPDLPHIAGTDDYYSAALVLLSRVAWRDSRRVAA